LLARKALWAPLQGDRRAIERTDANRQVELLQAESVGFIDETHVDMSRCQVPFLPMV
jgi:hypothetical protein